MVTNYIFITSIKFLWSFFGSKNALAKETVEQIGKYKTLVQDFKHWYFYWNLLNGQMAPKRAEKSNSLSIPGYMAQEGLWL